VASKTIDMGAAGTVTVMGCVVVVDGVEVDSWSSKTGKARAGRQVWTLSAEQVEALRANVGARETDEARPMRGFHR
jgi:hypothetical protein